MITPPSDALTLQRRLAAIRLLFGIYVVVYLLGSLPNLWKAALHPMPTFVPIGVLVWLQQPLPAWLVMALFVSCVALALAFLVGYRYRWSAPLLAVATVVLFTYRSSWGMIFHTENLMVLHLAVLSTAPAAEAWSWDAKHGAPPPRARSIYAGYILLLSWTTALTYFVAGWAKLARGGTSWLSGATLTRQIVYDNLRKELLGDTSAVMDRLVLAWPHFLGVLAIATLVIELGAPLAILRPRVGQVWAACAWGFHAGVALAMAIIFAYPLSGGAYLSFFRPERAVASLAQRVHSWRERRKLLPINETGQSAG